VLLLVLGWVLLAGGLRMLLSALPSRFPF